MLEIYSFAEMWIAYMDGPFDVKKEELKLSPDQMLPYIRPVDAILISLAQMIFADRVPLTSTRSKRSQSIGFSQSRI